MKDNATYLRHILECIERVEIYTRGGRDEFDEQTIIQDAVMRNIEIIGEASTNISQVFRDEHPEISWKALISFRNVLIHNYMGVRLEAVWNAAERLPQLKRAVSRTLASMTEAGKAP